MIQIRTLLTRDTWWATSRLLHKNRGRVSLIKRICRQTLILEMRLATRGAVWWVNNRVFKSSLWSNNRFINSSFQRFRERLKTTSSLTTKRECQLINKIDRMVSTKCRHKTTKVRWIRCLVQKLEAGDNSNITSKNRIAMIQLMRILTNMTTRWLKNRCINKSMRIIHLKTTSKKLKILTTPTTNWSRNFTGKREQTFSFRRKTWLCTSITWLIKL